MSDCTPLSFICLVITASVEIITSFDTSCSINNTTNCCQLTECRSGECYQLSCPDDFYLIPQHSTLTCSDNGDLIQNNVSNNDALCSRHCPMGFKVYPNNTVDPCLQCNGHRCDIVHSSHNTNGTHKKNDLLLVAALVIGCLALIIGICIVVFYICRRKMKQRLEREKQLQEHRQKTDNSRDVDTKGKLYENVDNVDMKCQKALQDELSKVGGSGGDIKLGTDVSVQHTGSGNIIERYVKDPTERKKMRPKSGPYVYADERILNKDNYETTSEDEENGYEEYEAVDPDKSGENKNESDYENAYIQKDVQVLIEKAMRLLSVHMSFY